MAFASSNGPIDYSSLTQAPDFAASLGEGYQIGAGIRADQMQRQQQQVALQQQAQYKADLQNAFNNPTAQTFAAMTAKYPQQREAFKQSWDMLDKGAQDDQFKAGTSVFAALANGQNDVAKQQLDKHIEAARNSGEDVTDLQNIRRQIDADPKVAQAHIGLVLSSTDPDRWGKIATEMRSDQAAPLQQAKLGAEADSARATANNAATSQDLDNQAKRAGVSNIVSQIGERAQRLGLDQDKLVSDIQAKQAELAQKNGTLDGEAKTLMNGAVVNSTTAYASATQQRDLASRLDSAEARSGIDATGSEAIKRLLGKQDAVTDLRNEYTRIRNSQAVKNLPPGSASDADVALAMQGFPPETANTQTLAKFLRGMAKLNDITATGEAAKADWVNSVGSLGKPKTDINVNGTMVPAGTSYSEFLKQYLPKKVGQTSAQQEQQQIPNRSYMKYATPGAQ